VSFRLVGAPSKSLRIWAAPDPKRWYVIGADVAQGTGGRRADWSAAVVLDCTIDHERKARCLDQVAEYHTKIEDPASFGHTLDCIGRFYGGAAGQALLIVEANNHGLTTINDLLGRDYWNMYTERVYDRVVGKYLNKVGWYNTQQHLFYLVNQSRRVFRDHPASIRSSALLQQMGSFAFIDRAGNRNVPGGTSKPMAMPGEHDDLVIAWMLAIEGANYANWDSRPGAEASLAGGAVDPKEPTGPDAWVHRREGEIVDAHDRLRMNRFEEEDADALPRFVHHMD